MRTFPVTSLPFGIASVILSCFIGTICTGLANEVRSNWATDAYKQNCPSVVFIQGDKVEDRRGGSGDSERTFNGMGSGIIIDERGYIITNYHVVRDIRKIQVKTHDEKDYIATLVAKDDTTDLALIKIDARTPLRPIVFGRSNDLMPGECCMAIGNPYGYVSSLTDGRISAIKREVGVNDSALVYRDAIQTNTEINPGNSGGPLINVNGEMIGINVAIRQGALGIAFATPVDQVVEVAAKLIGEVAQQKVILGLTVSQHEPSDYNALKQFILIVDSVESNSPAAQAGIQKGDILSGIGKYTLKNKFDFYRALLDLKSNEETAFTFFRNKEMHDVAVVVKTLKGGTVAQRTVSVSPQSDTTSPKTANRAVSNNTKAAELDKLVWENLGISYAAIPAQEFEQTYGQFLSQFDGGIVVKAVREGSPAEQAGLTPGDVITGVGPWAMTIANNVRYVWAQEWEKIQSENKSLQADVIRDNTHYKTEIGTR
ncbi:MAG: trypsin-like peptidase domain-containing protein [Planctomycetaceae bacterium]|jgi:serine protease Do|nr:trypsin-like peptidase domain-containing protein [Planctomycetaceae bacterium]